MTIASAPSKTSRLTQERILIEGQYLPMVGDNPNLAIRPLKYAEFLMGQQHDHDSMPIYHFGATS